MNRRRNRINAGLLAADELEEKTKIEASESVVDASVTENEIQQQMGVKTRNLRKRKRQE